MQSLIEPGIIGEYTLLMYYCLLDYVNREIPVSRYIVKYGV